MTVSILVFDSPEKLTVASLRICVWKSSFVIEPCNQIAELHGFGSSEDRTFMASGTEIIQSASWRPSSFSWRGMETMELSGLICARQMDVFVHFCLGELRPSPMPPKTTSSEPEYNRSNAIHAASTRLSGETSHCWQQAWINGKSRRICICSVGESVWGLEKNPCGRLDGVTSATSCDQR